MLIILSLLLCVTSNSMNVLHNTARMTLKNIARKSAPTSNPFFFSINLFNYSKSFQIVCTIGNENSNFPQFMIRISNLLFKLVDFEVHSSNLLMHYAETMYIDL